MPTPSCRFCASPLDVVFADLGMSPLANAYLTPDQGNAMEGFYPLRAFVCANCLLVQLEEFESPSQIFGDYAYFSSFSSSWLQHCERYADEITGELGLGPESQVVELASNDGYLLQFFANAGIPVLGVEPAENVAKVAIQAGIPTLVEFFGTTCAESLGESQADLLIGNNVLAHVPDLNDFVAGMKILLKPGGTITMEFPHLLQLMALRQFDTIYHEHFSYFSLATVRAVFAAHGLRVFDVKELPTHGGSIRIYASHDDDPRADTSRTSDLLAREVEAGLGELAAYTAFAEQVMTEKREILSFLIALKDEGLSMAGYGAPAKGNTLLNFCGAGRDFLDFTVDVNPHKQGRLLPGTHIPIHAVEELKTRQPDIVLILPWNLRDEIVREHEYVREWGGRFVARNPRMDFVG